MAPLARASRAGLASAGIAIGIGIAMTAACDGAIMRPPTPTTGAPPVPSASVDAATERRPPPMPTIVNTFPHDTKAFTQGLLFADGVLFESTGLYGESSLRRVELATGKVLTRVDLAPEMFGEGLALLHGELFQLTWREGRCFVYDAATLAKKRELTYDSEGWGMTTDGAELVVSDGTALLRYVDPRTFKTTRTLTVVDGSHALDHLNELEWVRGEIFANVWGRNAIARIDPRSGAVTSWIDLSTLPEPRREVLPDDVLNGIAYDDKADRLFVTGKRWGHVFQITWR